MELKKFHPLISIQQEWGKIFKNCQKCCFIYPPPPQFLALIKLTQECYHLVEETA